MPPEGREPSSGEPAHPVAIARPVAIVTGASSGMGCEIARLLAGRGFNLVLMARRTEKLTCLATELAPRASCRSVTADLTHTSTVEAALNGLGESGPIDVLVNNAGFGLYRPFLEHEPDDFRRLMEIHYFTAVATIRAVLPQMIERGRGHIINICSISSKMGPWGHAGYAAAKSALSTLTQCLAADYRGTGVNFSYVNPGIVATEYFEAPSYAPLKARVRQHGIPADRAAKKIVALLDRPRLELCIPGHYRILDWFKALSPSLTHRLVTHQSRPIAPKPLAPPK